MVFCAVENNENKISASDNNRFIKIGFVKFWDEIRKNIVKVLRL